MTCNNTIMTPVIEHFIADTLRQPDAACGSVAVGGGAAPGRLSRRAPASLRGAQARVVPWSLSRAAHLLAHAARRPLRLGETGIGPDARVVINILDALGRGDAEAADHAAEWLVRPHGREALLRALTPAAEALR